MAYIGKSGYISQITHILCDILVSKELWPGWNLHGNFNKLEMNVCSFFCRKKCLSCEIWLIVYYKMTHISNSKS